MVPASMAQRLVVSVVTDLFFAARIAETARAASVHLEATTAARAPELCRDPVPDLVIVDLSGSGDPLGMVRALKADATTRAVHIVGFCSHVERELRDSALAAGVDQVLPRSAFTATLAALLRGEAPVGPEREP